MNEKLIERLRSGNDEVFSTRQKLSIADALESLSAECTEQARLLGMSAEREADLLGKIERLERKLAIAREALHMAGDEPNIDKARKIADAALAQIGVEK